MVAGVSERASDDVAPPVTSGLSFRPDVEGLRAIAVGLVVLLHAGVTRLSGGYIGVDVFFVISGFLITSLLIDEFGATNRVSILGFYARRARRILPAACLVIAVTVIAVYVQLGALVGRRTAVDGIWSAAFLANFRFIATGTDYFASVLPPSALQNYWSLAVEEQFYFVWPSLFFCLMAFGRRIGRPTHTLRVGILAMLGCSLLWSIHQSTASPTAGYFSPFTRAWELGAGALTAAFAIHIGRSNALLRALATWIGLAFVLIAAFTFTSTTVFPGYAALLPVGGTVLLIGGGIGQPAGAAGMLLGLSPLRWLGRISFSLYLWHWPVLIIAEQRSAEPLDSLARVNCVLLALALSVASYYAVERPLHVSGFLKSGSTGSDWHRARKAILAGAVAIAFAVSVSVVIDSRAGSSIDEAKRADTAKASTAVDLTLTDAQITALEDSVERGVRAGLELREVPRTLNPPVLALGTAFVPKYGKCMLRDEIAAKTCTFGAKESSETVVVFGDSHAMSWMPALDAWGKAAGYRIVTHYKSRCPLPSSNAMCAAWRENALDAIAATRPVAVIMSFTERHDPQSDPDDPTAWIARFRTTVERLSASGAKLIEIANNPFLPEDPSLCLGRPNADPRGCEGAYTAQSFIDAELELVESTGGAGIHPEQWLCAESRCPVIIDGYIAYADLGHVSAQYVTRLAPLLAARLRAAGLR